MPNMSLRPGLRPTAPDPAGGAQSSPSWIWGRGREWEGRKGKRREERRWRGGREEMARERKGPWDCVFPVAFFYPSPPLYRACDMATSAMIGLDSTWMVHSLRILRVQMRCDIARLPSWHLYRTRRSFEHVKKDTACLLWPISTIAFPAQKRCVRAVLSNMPTQAYHVSNES